jgi:chromosome segregation ATPase
MFGALALFALTPLAAALLLLGSLYGQVERGRTSTSSASKELAAKPPPLKSQGEASAGTSETSPQTTQSIGKNAIAVTPLASAAVPDLQSVTTAARQSAETQQAIERLTADQARMLSENGELNKQLKEAQEMVRQNDRLMEDLKAAQTQLVLDKAKLEGQLQASEQQVTNLAAELSASKDDLARMEVKLNAGQEQIARLLSQKQQKQRPKQLSASNNPVPTASLRQPKPTPSPIPANSRAINAQKGAVAGSTRPTDAR